MTRQEIEQQVNRFFIEKLEFEESAITPDADLKENLGMTSIDAVEMRLHIYKHLGFQPQKKDMMNIRTVRDVYDYIEQHQPK